MLKKNKKIKSINIILKCLHGWYYYTHHPTASNQTYNISTGVC